jgi:hypothetical protein
MAKFKLEILHKVNDPAEASTLIDTVTTFPKYMVVKKPFPKIVEYLVCVPFVGDTFDRVFDQMLSINAPLKGDVADFATAVVERADVVDGLILEQVNADATVSVYTDDGNFAVDMIAEAPVVEADGHLSNIGGLRAREGWSPPSKIKPSGQAFNDSQLGVDGAAAAGFGKELG